MSTESILRLEEGKRLDLYQDTRGIWTIGIGYNIQARGLPDDIVEELFRRDLASLRADCLKYVPEYPALDPVRAGIIERMVFQMGVDGFLKFKGTRACIAAGDWEGASQHMLDSLWAKQVPARAKREAQRMLRGIE